jgi:hypothetical protein
MAGQLLPQDFRCGFYVFDLFGIYGTTCVCDQSASETANLSITDPSKLE